MTTSGISWGRKGDRRAGLTTLPLSCADCLQILVASKFWSPKGPIQACRGTVLPLHLLNITKIQLPITNSMVQSPSWEANWFAASQEIPRILWNPEINYRTNKTPPPVPILGQPIPVRIPLSHLLEIHPNIIHLSTPRSPLWSLSLRFPHQDPIRPPLLTHTRHMPSPSHSSNTYCITRWNIVVFDCMCDTQKFFVIWPTTVNE